MEIGARIRLLRKTLDMTQATFGAKIKLRPTTIGLIETGTRNATERVISDICREFDASEQWLLTGEGEMFTEYDRDESIAILAAKLIRNGSDNSFITKFIEVLSKLDESDWKTIEKLARLMAEQQKRG